MNKYKTNMEDRKRKRDAEEMEEEAEVFNI